MKRLQTDGQIGGQMDGWRTTGDQKTSPESSVKGGKKEPYTSVPYFVVFCAYY